ncbi:MAG: hypothetical protein Q7S32_01515 [bacterium]|nr:hypothetical protein [bacterium]
MNIFQYLKSKLKEAKGFTAVETIATVFVFSIVVVVFGDAFVHSLNLQRTAFSIQQVEENASFILEAMAKEIRVSQISGVDTNCPASPSSSLNMVHPVNGDITYTLVGNDVHRIVDSGGGPTDTIFNSNTVQFTRLQFCILGTASADGEQPRVTILAGLRSTNSLQQATMELQTTVSGRSLND